MKKLVLILVAVLLMWNVGGALAIGLGLDDGFDDGSVDTGLWTIAGNAGEVWESGTTLYMDDSNSAAPRPGLISRADNGYSWTVGRAIIDWDAGGKYAGLMTTAGGGHWLMARKDVSSGWTLSINDADGLRNYNLNSSFDKTVGWHWEIVFGSGTVRFKGRRYTESNWEIDNTYDYNSSGVFMLQAHSATTTAEFGRMAFVPPDTKDLNDLFADAVVDTDLWTIGGDAGEVWESGTTLYMDDSSGAFPRPYVSSRNDNDYLWTTNRAVIDWSSGGRFAGLMTIGDGYWLMVRKDLSSVWTISINDADGSRNYNLSSGFDETVGWHWEIVFGGGQVVFSGRRYTETEWEINQTNSYNISDAFMLQAHSYGTTAEFDRLAVMPVPGPAGTLIILQ